MDDSAIKKQLDKITQSEVFARSNTSQRLLKYLAESTLQGKHTKEASISIDVFKHSAEDPGTSNIRVHIHKLRKNLVLYYSNEGRKDPIYFSIPKGSYSVEFKRKREVNKILENRHVWFGVSAIIIAGLLVNVLLLVTQQTNYTKLKKTNFWHEIMDRNKETVIVIGDYFMFRDQKILEDYDRAWNIRDIQINTEEELQQYLNSNDALISEDYIPLEDVSYISFDVLRCMPHILPLFHDNHINYQIISSAEFNWRLFADYNIVYIGSFKNLKSLSAITDKLHIKFDGEKYSLLYTDPDKPRTYTPYFSHESIIDYAFVSKIPRSNNSAIYFFVSTHDIGYIGSVRYFTQPESLKHFENVIQREDEYFKAIFKAEGFERTIEKFNMVEYKSISDSILNDY